MNNVLTKDFYKTLEFVGEHKNAPEINTDILQRILTANGDANINISSDPRVKICLCNYFAQVKDNNLLGIIAHISTDGIYGGVKFYQLARIGDDGLQCVVDLDDLPFALATVKQWIVDNAKKFKIRIGEAVHIKKVIRMMEALFKPYADTINLDQGRLKEYINGCNAKTFYVYATTSLENYSFEDMDRLILECYATQENSKSNSCMTKCGDDWTMIGEDYDSHAFPDCKLENGVWIHPFHTYNTRDWKFVFVSKHAPEKVLKWEDESKSPFIARSIAFNYNTYNENGDQKWYVRNGNVCYGAREIATQAILAYYPQSDNTSGCKVRLYDSRYGDRIMAYVDGNHQDAGVILSSLRDETAEGLTVYYDVAEMSESNRESWESTGGYAIAERKYHYEYCKIMGEDIPADEAVWISDIDGYVHERFTTSDGELDGLEIYHWYN